MPLFRLAFSHKRLFKTDKAFVRAGGVVLEPKPWNDHGFLCTFGVVTTKAGRPFPLGEWKIVDPTLRRRGATEVPERFRTLPRPLVSLGQQVANYERLAELPAQRRREILRGLGDLVVRPVAGVNTSPAFRLGLARFSEAREVLRTRGVLMRKLGLRRGGVDRGKEDSPQRIDLRVAAQLTDFGHKHHLRLSFSRDPGAIGLRRAVVLVGPNGSGKTQLLAQLGQAFSGLDNGPTTIAPASPFTNTLAISFSAFDRFTRPKADGGAASYRYVGLRAPSRDQADTLRLDIDAALARTQEHVRALLSDPERRAPWLSALEHLGLMPAARDLLRRPGATRRRLSTLSAGTQVAIVTVTHLARHLRPGAIVLFDEPELHLHPRLLSGLLRALRQLLEHFDAFAIIATHSLIVVQETPAPNVVVLRPMNGAGVIAGKPTEQCFASPLDEIERAVFGSREDDLNYLTLLSRLAPRMSRAALTTLLGGQLGLGARLALAADAP